MQSKTFIGIGSVAGQNYLPVSKKITMVESFTGLQRAIKQRKQRQLISTVLQECFKQASEALANGDKEEVVYWLNRASYINRDNMTAYEKAVADA
jgi:hypothetical protein